MKLTKPSKQEHLCVLQNICNPRPKKGSDNRVITLLWPFDLIA